MTTATVVGSGPNGLAAAIRLAQEGISVTVVEANNDIGGGARTSELTVPGVLHDDCSTAMPGALASPFFQTLDLESHGVTWLHHDTVVAHPTPAGTGVAFRSLERTVESMGAAGPAWRRLFGPLVADATNIFDTAFNPIVRVPRHPITVTRFGLRALPPATMIARMLGERAGATYVGIAAHGFSDLGALLSPAAGTMLTTALHAHGWPIVQGGAQRLTEALASILTGLGGRIETGRRIPHVRELDTDLTLLTAPPERALTMVDVAGAPRRAWQRFRRGPAAFKLDLAIDGDVPWRDEACRNAGVIHLGGTARDIAFAEREINRGRMPEHPFILVSQPHLVDPSRSSGSINPLWVYAHVPNGWPNDETETILRELEGYAPGLRERIVGMHVRTPADFEAHNASYLGGDIGGGANTMRQLIARPRAGKNAARSGVSGVYLAGTAPASGVHGMGGFFAAQTALEDLRR